MYKLLIVDDEAFIRKGILKLVDFEKLGIDEQYEASNGTEGFALYKQHSPQLVLLDINLPQINGLDLARMIKEQNQPVKIAMITGYDYVDYAISAIKIGVDDYILKPVSRQDVTDVLIKLIDRYETEMKAQAVQQVVTGLVDHPQEATLKQKLQECIEQSLSDPNLSLTSVATSFGYASSYLSTRFKNLFGMSFQDYVLLQRMERAKLLLLTTTLKNYEIAERIGIVDVNYFNTRFKLKYGMTPKQYVSQVRNPHENS